MKSFDQAVHTYESHGFIQREMAAWLAEWLPARREGTAVEAGAGTGFFTQHLLPWNGRFIATDASPSMVALGSARWPQTDWRVAEAADLPSVSTNWILSSSFLQWARDPVSLLRDWKERLAPGGRILTGLFVAPTLPELDQVLPGSAPLQWRTPAQWKEIVIQADLHPLRTEEARRLFVFPSALELLRTLHRTGAAPVRRTSAASLRHAIREYDRRFSCPGGVCSTWTFYRVEALAQEKAF
jgi:malonyl-CoA O-methyltransferase